MQKVTFDVVSRPTKEAVGVTNVSNVSYDKDGNVSSTVLIGTVTKARGSDVFSATMNKDGNAVSLGDSFTSRSQAGHAIQRAYFADVRDSKASARAAKLAAAEVEKAAKAQARAEAKVKREAEKAAAAELKAAEKLAKAEAKAAAKAAKEAEKAAAEAAKAAETPAETVEG